MDKSKWVYCTRIWISDEAYKTFPLYHWSIERGIVLKGNTGGWLHFCQSLNGTALTTTLCFNQGPHYSLLRTPYPLLPRSFAQSGVRVRTNQSSQRHETSRTPRRERYKPHFLDKRRHAPNETRKVKSANDDEEGRGSDLHSSGIAS